MKPLRIKNQNMIKLSKSKQVKYMFFLLMCRGQGAASVLDSSKCRLMRKGKDKSMNEASRSEAEATQVINLSIPDCMKNCIIRRSKNGTPLSTPILDILVLSDTVVFN